MFKHETISKQWNKLDFNSRPHEEDLLNVTGTAPILYYYYVIHDVKCFRIIEYISTNVFDTSFANIKGNFYGVYIRNFF